MDSPSRANQSMTLLSLKYPQLQVNTIITRSTAKRRISEVQPETESDLSDHIQRPHQPETSSAPLICNPPDLWHLRFGHASTIMLGKLTQIKSSHQPSTCDICICVKKTRNPFPSSDSKATMALA